LTIKLLKAVGEEFIINVVYVASNN
jgi:hypothetical protein